MKVLKAALLSLVLSSAYGLDANSTASGHRVLGESTLVRTSPPLDVHKEGPRFRKGQIVVKGSPLDLPPGIKVIKYLKKANLTVVKVTNGHERALVKKLRKKGKLAEENYEMYASALPNDSYFRPYQWHMDTVQGPAAWDITTGQDSSGQSVIVAVLDTGLLDTKPYGGDGIGCIVKPYNTVTESTNVNDVDGHGTHVAGTIAQTTGNGKGTLGLAYDACIMPVKVLGDDGSGSFADIAEGIYYAVDNGAKVINMSLGVDARSGMMSDNGVVDQALQYAYSKGVTVAAASGNDSYGGNVAYPGVYPTCISVGSVGYNEQRAGYSNYGQGLDIVAPGGDTSVDRNGDGYADGVLQETIQSGSIMYSFFQGTSMASPHVAAAAALLIADGSATTPDEVRAALSDSAKNVGSSDLYGAGLIQVYDALMLARQGRNDSGGGTGTGTATPAPTPKPTPSPTPATTPAPTPFPTPNPTSTPETSNCNNYRERCGGNRGECCGGLTCRGRRPRCKY